MNSGDPQGTNSVPERLDGASRFSLFLAVTHFMLGWSTDRPSNRARLRASGPRGLGSRGAFDLQGVSPLVYVPIL